MEQWWNTNGTGHPLRQAQRMLWQVPRCGIGAAPVGAQCRRSGLSPYKYSSTVVRKCRGWHFDDRSFHGLHHGRVQGTGYRGVTLKNYRDLRRGLLRTTWVYGHDGMSTSTERTHAPGPSSRTPQDDMVGASGLGSAIIPTESLGKSGRRRLVVVPAS